MKRIAYILCLLILCTLVSAQVTVIPELDKLTDEDITGTARYVAMSGAFAALGGDVSAAQNNPAALGVFRRSEVSISGDYHILNTQGKAYKNISTRFGMPQLAWVISWHNSDRMKGMLFTNFMLQYQRLKDFRQTTHVTGVSALSQTDLMAVMTEGLTKDDFSLGTEIWYDGNIGWLSVIGHDGNLIREYQPYAWQSRLLEGDKIKGDLQLSEAGTMDAYSLSWGTNISNKVYVGVRASLHTLSYEKVAQYTEQLPLLGQYTITSTTNVSGLGFNAAAGVIYRPTDYLRLGASFLTPTWMSLSQRHYATYESSVDSILPLTETAYISEDFGKRLLPMRAVGGIAYQVNNIGLISLEYDYTHQIDKIIADVHWLRLGTEWIAKNNWFFRAGYAYKSDFGAGKALSREIYVNDIRTDTDYRYIPATQYASAGFGYRNKRMIADIAYQCRWNNATQYLFPGHEGLAFQNLAHRVVITLAWTSPH